MKDQLSEFESQLHRLTPSNCDHIAEDTFYRVGWNAAVQSLQSQNLTVRRPLRHGMSFVSGLLCGLLGCAMAMTVWRSSGDAKSVVQTERIESIGVPSAALPDEEHADVRSEVKIDPEGLVTQHPLPADLFSIVSSNLPWHLPTADKMHGGTFSANRTLSVAARSQWDNMIAAESTTGMMATEARDTSEPRIRNTLRAFPLSEWAIRDLL